MDRAEREEIRRQATALNSDGCTGVLDLYRVCCEAHDIAYRTQKDHHGNPITRAQADAAFRACIQAQSPLGGGSMLSWWRWLGVRALGWMKWGKA